MNGSLGKSISKNSLTIKSSDLQLAKEFSEYFLLKVKVTSDMIEDISPSKSQLFPDFPISYETNFAEINKEVFLCIVLTVKKT